MRTYIALLALIVSSAQAATWERPAGAYTPTNHSVNTTKYQTDRANNVAISSAKVDGDVNKAFEGLNSLEARVAPNVVGQSGKFLTNNGAASFWGLISNTSILSGAAAAGQVLKTNGSGSTVFGLLDTTSFPNLGVSGTYVLPTLSVNTAGMVTSVTATSTISATNLYASGTLTVSGTSRLGVVSASQVITGAVATTSLTSPFALKAWVTFDGTASSPFTAVQAYGVESSITRTNTGKYSFTFPSGTFATSTVLAVCSGINPTADVLVGTVESSTATSAVVRFKGTAISAADVNPASCMFFGL